MNKDWTDAVKNNKSLLFCFFCYLFLFVCYSDLIAFAFVGVSLSCTNTFIGEFLYFTFKNHAMGFTFWVCGSRLNCIYNNV